MQSTVNSPAATAPKPVPQKFPNPMNDWDDDEPAKTGFQKYRLPIVIGVLVLGGGGFAAKMLSNTGGGHAAPPPPPPMQVKLVLPPTPPPPPPPPPPQDTPKEEEKMIEEEKQEEAPPEPAPSMETALKGPGNGSGMVLKQGNGNGLFGGRGGAPNPRQQWSAYANKVKSRIEDALRSNPKTRSKAFSGKFQVWTDSSGRVTRIELSDFTGDPAAEAAIREQIPNTIQVEGRPDGMPAYIYMRVSGRRPN